MCIRDSYMAITVGSENHLGMGNHFMQEGLAYRFTPFDTCLLYTSLGTRRHGILFSGALLPLSL